MEELNLNRVQGFTLYNDTNLEVTTLHINGVSINDNKLHVDLGNGGHMNYNFDEIKHDNIGIYLYNRTTKNGVVLIYEV